MSFHTKHLLVQNLDKVDGVVKNYNGTRYSESLGPRIYNAIHDRISYLISEKIDDKYIINHNFAGIRIDSNNSLHIEKNTNF